MTLSERWRKDAKRLGVLAKRSSTFFENEKPSSVVFVCMVHILKAIDNMDEAEAVETAVTVVNVLKDMTTDVEETLQ